MLVGGKLEPGEDARAAAVRETREEVGLDVDRLELLGQFSAEAANEPGLCVHSTVFVADLPGEPVAAAEIVELRWTPLASESQDLAPLLARHVLPELRAGRAERDHTP